MPCAMASRGERMSTIAPSRRITPASAGRTPNSASATSVRPEPTSPANPSTSPARTSKVMSSNVALAAEALDAEGDVAGLVGDPAEEVGQLTPDHVADQRRPR